MNLRKTGHLNKDIRNKLLTALSKIKFDVKGTLKFNKSGEATTRLVGRIEDLPIGDVDYRIVIEAVINAHKEIDFETWNTFDGHNSTYRICLYNNENEKLPLTPEFYEQITDVLHSNTIVY